MQRTSLALITVIALVWPAVVLAEESKPLPLRDQVRAQASEAKPKLFRSESLEIPGLTACHQCEWRPKPHEMAAVEQCGTSPDGQANVALFECGFSQNCDRVCNFVRCKTP